MRKYLSIIGLVAALVAVSSASAAYPPEVNSRTFNSRDAKAVVMQHLVGKYGASAMAGAVVHCRAARKLNGYRCSINVHRSSKLQGPGHALVARHGNQLNVAKLRMVRRSHR